MTQEWLESVADQIVEHCAKHSSGSLHPAGSAESALACEHGVCRVQNFAALPVLRFNNEEKNAPLPEPKGLLYLAKLYAEREGLEKEMIPHLHRMLLLGGGRMPKTETKKNLGRINLYEGNSEYRDAVIDDVSSPYLHEPTE